MEYNSLNDLRTSWLSGEFEYPEEFNIGGVVFKRRISPPISFEDVVIHNSKAYVMYATSAPHKEEAKELGLNQLIIFVWGVEKNAVIPFDVRSVSPHRFHSNSRVMEQQERIGDVVILKIFLPSGAAAVKGKVDTGAEISSLHADKFEISNGTVRFVNKELSDNVISAPLAEKQAVKSADGGVEYRPVIELDIEINGKPVRRALFNLNDRDHMDYSCLVGQNVLEKTNFLIDPKINDVQEDEWMDEEWLIPEAEELSIDITALNEEFKDIEPIKLESAIQTEKAAALYKALEESNITFQDLVRFIRTDARNVMEDLEY